MDKASSLLAFLSVACVAIGVFSLEDSQSFESFLSAIGSVEDQDVYAEKLEALTPSLEQDLREFAASSHVSRFRRDALENHRIYPKCCGSGDTPDFTMETVKIYENCTAELKKGGGENGEGVCDIAMCIAREKNMLDKDGFVIEEEFLKLIDQAYTDVSLKGAAKKAGPDCVKKANDRAKEIMSQGSLGRKCNLAGIMAYHCSKYEVILSCPADQTVHSEECEKFRQMMHEWKNEEQKKPDN